MYMQYICMQYICSISRCQKQHKIFLKKGECYDIFTSQHKLDCAITRDLCIKTYNQHSTE